MRAKDHRANPHYFAPTEIRDNSTIKRFNLVCRRALGLLLNSLSWSLRLSSSLASLHREDHPSLEIICFLRHHALPDCFFKPSYDALTDIGTPTLVFSDELGLQVLRPSDNEWAYIPLKSHMPAHDIVLVGRSLSCFTSGFLRGCPYRIAPLPGQAMKEEYRIVYMQRVEDDVGAEPL